MPGYRQHLIGGVALYLLLLVLLREQCSSSLVAGEWLVCALLGSLFPDIDIKSKGQQLFYTLTGIAIVGLIFSNRMHMLPVIGIGAVVPPLVRHRGLFHRAWFLVLLSGVIWIIAAFYAPEHREPLFFDVLFFLSGALSHIWLDMGIKGLFQV